MLHRDESSAHISLKNDGIPDCVLHRDDSHLHTDVLKVKGFRIACYTQKRQSPANRDLGRGMIPGCVLHAENTVTCKQRF